MKKNIFFLTALIIFAVYGCKATPQNTEVVVSDGITSNALAAEPEIAPSATVYQIENKDKQNVLKFFLGKKLPGMQVQFYARPIGSSDDEWIKLGDGPIETDSNGKATLTGLRKWLTTLPLGATPFDLQLKAEVIFSDSKTVSDDKGLIRVLSSPDSPFMDPLLDRIQRDNPYVVAADHDNTLHATGGMNSIPDAINALNMITNNWPLVDGNVVASVKKLISDGRDFIIATAMPNECRAICREQMNLHFEGSGQRKILIFLKSDLEFAETNKYKSSILGIFKKLYGENKVLAMVGDTPHEDGFGAFDNKIFYIPYKVNYFVMPLKDLDTGGYGFIVPDSIAWDWSQVLADIEEGDKVTNYYLRNANGFANIAHRGGAALMPENTLEAFSNGIDSGAVANELDLQMSKDGNIVISHDSTVDRCTDSTGLIPEMNLADIQNLDAGYRFTINGGASYPFRGQGIRIPTLEEYLSDPKLSNASIVIEIKQLEASLSDKLLDLISTYHMEDKVIVESFDKAAMADFRKEIAIRDINVITSFTQAEIIDFFLTPLSVMLATKYTPPAKVLQVPVEFDLGGINVGVVNDIFMLKARYLGLKVHAWTVNDEAEMQKLINEQKVDGIMTDNPVLLKSVMQ